MPERMRMRDFGLRIAERMSPTLCALAQSGFGEPICGIAMVRAISKIWEVHFRISWRLLSPLPSQGRGRVRVTAGKPRVIDKQRRLALLACNVTASRAVKGCDYLAPRLGPTPKPGQGSGPSLPRSASCRDEWDRPTPRGAFRSTTEAVPRLGVTYSLPSIITLGPESWHWRL